MKLNGCKPNAIIYRNLAFGCMKAGLVKEALKTLHLRMEQTAINQQDKEINPMVGDHSTMVEIFAEKGDVENAEKLFQELKANNNKYTFVYNPLIKAYVKAKVYSPNLLRRIFLKVLG
ncbi:hypothetical protein Nepgr_000100 [Nepenthes gracilis]|uniref:Pentatricopeptide repeat-containing protein n=1 Tax=Nepenthes gracilis TaxID=150966 RepID=A0AAD3P2R9_NEPGR|nr:hypothetical protein Nepgr_000100 [Nepenthes gracilis]